MICQGFLLLCFYHVLLFSSTIEYFQLRQVHSLYLHFRYGSSLIHLLFVLCNVLSVIKFWNNLNIIQQNLNIAKCNKIGAKLECAGNKFTTPLFDRVCYVKEIKKILIKSSLKHPIHHFSKINGTGDVYHENAANSHTALDRSSWNIIRKTSEKPLKISSGKNVVVCLYQTNNLRFTKFLTNSSSHQITQTTLYKSPLSGIVCTAKSTDTHKYGNATYLQRNLTKTIFLD